MIEKPEIVQFETVRDDGSGLSKEPRNDGRDEACRECAVLVFTIINVSFSCVLFRRRDPLNSPSVKLLYRVPAHILLLRPQTQS